MTRIVSSTSARSPILKARSSASEHRSISTACRAAQTGYRSSAASRGRSFHRSSKLLFPKGSRILRMPCTAQSLPSGTTIYSFMWPLVILSDHGRTPATSIKLSIVSNPIEASAGSRLWLLTTRIMQLTYARLPLTTRRGPAHLSVAEASRPLPCRITQSTPRWP